MISHHLTTSLIKDVTEMWQTVSLPLEAFGNCPNQG